jgi:hypothetical protein
VSGPQIDFYGARQNLVKKREKKSDRLAEGFIKSFKHDCLYVSKLPHGPKVRKKALEWLWDKNEYATYKGLSIKSLRVLMELLVAS